MVNSSNAIVDGACLTSQVPPFICCAPEQNNIWGIFLRLVCLNIEPYFIGREGGIYKESMIANLIGGFVAILIGTSLVGPVSTEVNTAAATSGALANSSSWGATVLKLVPGFFALGILGIGIAVTYSSLRQAGVV